MHHSQLASFNVIVEKRYGLSISRNIGIENSSSDFIWFLDDDVYVFDYSIDKIKDHLNRNPSFDLHTIRMECYDNTSYKKYSNKIDAIKTECGKDSLTNFFIKKGYDVFIINSSGVQFDLYNMEKSMTYCNSSIADVLISDRHHRKYQLLSFDEQIKTKKKVWSNN